MADHEDCVRATVLHQRETECRTQLSSCSDSPRRALLLNRLGRLLYDQVRFDEAKEAYTAALAEQPNLAAAAHNRATIHYRMGEFGAALRDLELAQSVEPDNQEVATGLYETRRLLDSSGAQ